MKELIESILDCKKIDLPKNKIFIKNNYIYLINGNKVTIGYLNKKLIFIEKYILSFISKEILGSEKNFLFEFSIKNYINSIKNDDSYKIEINNEKIGPLTILINKKLSLYNSSHILRNKAKEELPSILNNLKLFKIKL